MNPNFTLSFETQVHLAFSHRYIESQLYTFLFNTGTLCLFTQGHWIPTLDFPFQHRYREGGERGGKGKEERTQKEWKEYEKRNRKGGRERSEVEGKEEREGMNRLWKERNGEGVRRMKDNKEKDVVHWILTKHFQFSHGYIKSLLYTFPFNTGTFNPHFTLPIFT